jgi:hypothetical protein
MQGVEGLKVSEAAVRAKFGNEVLVLAKEVYEFAVNYPVDWEENALTESLLDIIRAATKAKYPFLDAETEWLVGYRFAFFRK